MKRPEPVKKRYPSINHGEYLSIICEGISPEHLALYGPNVALKAQDPEGRKGIHCAAGRDDVPLVEYFISCGADIDEPCRRGLSPLMYAVMSDRLDACQFLIQKGASLEVPAQFINLLHFARLFDAETVTPFLTSHIEAGDLDKAADVSGAKRNKPKL